MSEQCGVLDWGHSLVFHEEGLRVVMTTDLDLSVAR